jgi:hypothetical protein
MKWLIFFHIFFLELSTYIKKHKVVTIKIGFTLHQSFVIAAIFINLCLMSSLDNSFRSTLFSCATVIVSP